MSIQNYFVWAIFLMAIFMSIDGGVYLIVRYPTRLARWGGLCLLSLAVELGCYLLQLILAASPGVHVLFLIQVIAYTLFCVFWLLFVFTFSRHTPWIRPRTLVFMLILPVIYVFLMGLRLTQGALANGNELGSLFFSPLAYGAPGILFVIFGYGTSLISVSVLVLFFSRSNPFVRKLILPLLISPILLALVGMLELAGINPFRPFSIQQFACAIASILCFLIVFDLRFGSVLSFAHETVIDQMQDGVLILDQQDRIVDLNPAARQIIGPSSEYVVNRKLSAIWPEGAGVIVGQSSPALKNTLQVNGLEFTFDINSSQLFDAYREPLGRVVVLRNVTSRERMETALTERTQQLSRTNAFLSGLAEVNVQLQTTTDPAHINAILGDELKKLGLVCFVARLEPDSQELVISYLSNAPEVVRRIEKWLGIELQGFRLGRAQFSPLYRFLESNAVNYAKYHPDDLTYGPGKLPAALLEQIMRACGLEPEMAVLILPFVTGARALGLMGVWGPGLSEADIAPFRIFASQVAHVMERAILYEAEIRRSAELARSNAMIIALSNVAAKLDTTTNLTQVFDTLGAELKKVRVNYMVGTLDAAQQEMKIEYLSIAPEVTQWANRLGAFWPQELTIPRRLWPTDKAVTEKAPYWDPDPIGNTSRMFPFVHRQIFLRTFEVAGLNAEDQVCYLPMISEEAVIGILAVWGPNLRNEDIPGLSVFANQVATAIRNTRLYHQAQQEILERTQAEARIQAALSEKEVLLKEVHHRVKNNLQVISSMLNLQAGQIADPQTVEALRESQTRVRSMALIHEKLYQSPDLARVDFADYLKRLVNSLVQTYRVKSGKVALHVQADEIALNIDTAIPCGLIVNELVSNSLKYAFPAERTGTIGVACRRTPAGGCILSVGDDGVGLPAGLDVTRSPSLGLKLVTGLVQQIDGELVVNGESGVHYEIRFKES